MGVGVSGTARPAAAIPRSHRFAGTPFNSLSERGREGVTLCEGAMIHASYNGWTVRR